MRLGSRFRFCHGAVAIKNITETLYQTQTSWNLVCPYVVSQFPHRFEISHIARQYHCRAVCKISRRLCYWNGCYGRKIFHDILVCYGFRMDILYCNSPWSHPYGKEDKGMGEWWPIIFAIIVHGGSLESWCMLSKNPGNLYGGLRVKYFQTLIQQGLQTTVRRLLRKVNECTVLWPQQFVCSVLLRMRFHRKSFTKSAKKVAFIHL